MVRDKYAQLLKQNPPEPNSGGAASGRRDQNNRERERLDRERDKEREREKDNERDRERVARRGGGVNGGGGVEKKSRSPDQRTNKRLPSSEGGGLAETVTDKQEVVKSERDRDYGKDRDRDRDRYRDRDRDRDSREYDRDRRKKRSWSRDRDRRDGKRSYDDRPRDRDRDRDRTRDRDRERERETEKGNKGKTEKEFPTNLDAFLQGTKVSESEFKDRKQFISQESERLTQLERSLQTRLEPAEEDDSYFNSLLGKRTSHSDRKRDRDDYDSSELRPPSPILSSHSLFSTGPRRKRGDIEEGEEPE
jgi:hypothetical protein